MKANNSIKLKYYDELIYTNSINSEQMCRHYCTRALYTHINYNIKLTMQKVFIKLENFMQIDSLLDFVCI